MRVVGVEVVVRVYWDHVPISSASAGLSAASCAAVSTAGWITGLSATGWITAFCAATTERGYGNRSTTAAGAAAVFLFHCAGPLVLLQRALGGCGPALARDRT